ncbi:hypothetical protein DQW77_13640 [Roseovarius sp. TE539]|uniref:Hint domain-containing protein n=1 Tax=Roseovarius sp. TE539 TaxID=2249812 RepID=UPI000DE191C4|nr:Hint domain-containing protein [Roseovarius sp. TE539]RBI70588.1 hypothetical protein DQW77_13640 [Roseovarius sp. TE539]
MTTNAAQSVPVYHAGDITVVHGANLGDQLSFAAELELDDTYELSEKAHQYRLSIVTGEGPALTIGNDTALGRPGATLHVDCCLTLMSGSGETNEVLVLVEVDTRGDVEAIYALPLAPLTPRIGYALVGIERDSARRRLAEVSCVSFSRGTHITMASGEQRPVEALQVGDMVLTRDDGPQQVRWVGGATMRAVGAFAPIRIRAGTLHNANDLLVSPDHRLFIYQRSDALGAGRHEVLVRARHLVNGETVVREDGGFVDYFQILFDEHQIIYAEGIAAETLLVDTRTRPALPLEISERLAQPLPGHGPRTHLEFEVTENLLDRPDAAGLLRRASTR